MYKNCVSYSDLFRTHTFPSNSRILDDDPSNFFFQLFGWNTTGTKKNALENGTTTSILHLSHTTVVYSIRSWASLNEWDEQFYCLYSCSPKPLEDVSNCVATAALVFLYYIYQRVIVNFIIVMTNVILDQYYWARGKKVSIIFSNVRYEKVSKFYFRTEYHYSWVEWRVHNIILQLFVILCWLCINNYLAF